MSENELSHCVAFDKIVAGRNFHALVAADYEQLLKLAKRLKLISLNSFQGTVNANYDKQTHIFTLEGTIEAAIVQECAVSLEPIEQKLDFDFKERLIRPKYYNEADYEHCDLDDEPEVYEGDELDLGEVMVQVLALNIPDFPRKEDAQVDAKYSPTEEELNKKNPFAMLEKLKKNDNNQ